MAKDLKIYWVCWIVDPCSRKQCGMIGTANFGINVKYPWAKVLTTGSLPLSHMNQYGWIWSRSRANELHVYHSTGWVEKHISSSTGDHEIGRPSTISKTLGCQRPQNIKDIHKSVQNGRTEIDKGNMSAKKDLWVNQLVFPKDRDFLPKSQCHAMPMFGSCPVLRFIRMNDQITVINMVYYVCKSVCSIYSPLKYLHFGRRCISLLNISIL